MNSAVAGSGNMFDAIARRYDFLNRTMSLGQDVRWRKRLIRALELSEGARLLDLATGTGDVAILAARSGAQVIGVDPSAKMLAVAAEKIEALGLAASVTLAGGIAESISLPDASVDAVSIAFGIRNVPDRTAALGEMRRVTKPGGRLGILELTEPTGGILSPLARLHVHHVLPRLGALLSGASEYRYLQTSIAAFPAPAVFAASIERAGWRDVGVERLTLGTCHLFTGRA